MSWPPVDAFALTSATFPTARTPCIALIEKLDTMDAHAATSILVNNAGTIRRAPAAEHSDEDWDHVIEVDRSAPFVLTRELGKSSMIDRGGGKIVSSSPRYLSFQGGIMCSRLCRRQGRHRSTDARLRQRMGFKGVNVNAVAPGYIATDNTAALQADPDRTRSLMERIPVGRWGTAEEIAEPVAFLCSDLARFVHGTILPADGGWMSR
jgi:2-deoxy-D-gluconate 3-dehydrogenase